MIVRSKRKFSRWIVAASIGMAVVVGSVGAHAEDDDDALLDTKILRGVLKGLGLQRDDGTAIDYRERSPLVLPAGKELPAPEANKAKAANWPDDPDIKKVRKRKEAARDRKAYVEGVDDRPLLPNQYNTAPAKGSKAGEAAGRSTDESSRPASLSELGSKSIFSNVGSLFGAKEEYSTFSGEPPRASLTEPPRGYRTPSPDQPYGVGKDKWAAPKIDRQEPVR